MILWDILIKEHESSIGLMSQMQQYRFAACCICESVLHLIGQQDDELIESIQANLQDSIILSSLIADGVNLPSEVHVTEKSLTDLEDFIEIIETSSTQVPGLYDLSMALFTFIESIENHSIAKQTTEIASYSYQAILDEQLMFNLPKRSITDSELVHLEEKNLICTQIIAAQIEWYRNIKDDKLIPIKFETLRRAISKN
ncbi:hypothetical protein [Chamaesiphon minutus]|uniref:DUF416 family protein n=1 Tax=Chamaesiphon minutus (strain ATCC 27169 / PCC 6605) TaxID=1173020 RepID=K9UIK9_CHAP6|nr:hypothetical protein [Chamaesiphon minutus]AFY94645.1 hypothetical protein Cha6605_3665 [Chamaesiphon minutus PCC 6605]